MITKWKKCIIPIFLLGALIAISCQTNILDQTNREELSQETFWRNANDARKGIIATYAAGLQAYDGSKWTFFEENFVAVTYKSDEIINNPAEFYGKGLASYTHGTDESSFANFWRTRYTGIFFANQVIENVPNINMDAANRSGIVAEAKFLRAIYHFDLLNFFGNIPLILATPQSVDDYFPAQAAPAQVWQQIETDLTEAIADLPNSYDSSNLGRATKTTAQGYLGKVYLFQEKWTEAITQFENVIGSGAYSLLTNYDDNFNGSSENGPESVFEIQFSSNRDGGNDERQVLNFEVGSYALGGWELYYPSEWLFEQMMTDTLADGSFSDRVYSTIFFDDPNSFANTTTTGERMAYADIKDQLGNQKIFFNKYGSDGETGGVGNFYGGINVHMMRYSDLLLMYAEALNEAGRTADAIESVNQVRRRVQVLDLPGSMTQPDLRDHIRNFERPVELASEFGIRWMDLVRWGRGGLSIKQVLLDHRKPGAENFVEGKHELYPIPLSEINKNSNLVQNPNW